MTGTCLILARSLSDELCRHRSPTVRIILTSYQASLALGLSLKSITKTPPEYLTEQLSRQLTALKKTATAFAGTRGITFLKVLEWHLQSRFSPR